MSESEIVRRAVEGDATLLQHSQVTTARDKEGSSALHLLAQTGLVDALSHPDVATVRDPKGLTPLHIFAKNGIAFEDVLAHPACATARDTHMWTPLHYLANAGAASVLQHPDVATVEDKAGRTPLLILAHRGSREIRKVAEKMLKEVRNREAQESAEATELLVKSAKAGNIELLQHPKAATATDKNGMTPLHWLAVAGVDVMGHPAAQKVSDSQGRTPAQLQAERASLVALAPKTQMTFMDWGLESRPTISSEERER